MPTWTVLFDDDFRVKFRSFSIEVREAIAAYAKLLERERDQSSADLTPTH